MLNKTLLLATLLFLGGCTLKENSNLAQLLTKDDIYHMSLQNTQKAQLMASFETKALLTATYLNPVYSSENCKNFCMDVEDGEYFFIGVYIRDSKSHQFNDKGYSLKLDGKKPEDIEKLDKDDPLRYEMPMVNNWSTYYKVKFPKSAKEELTLVFESDRFGKDVLKFSRKGSGLF
ncbi:MAG TPA: hypothetical protein ENK86_01325 [Campylobacterales bacterium]|nr:hypothetical protein [Campylobacterales bacterium]